MTITWTQLELILEELAEPLDGAVTRRVDCVDERTLCLEMRAPGRNLHPLISLSPTATRLVDHLERPPRAPEPTHFVLLVRKWLVNSRSRAPRLAPDDRHVEWTFQTRESELRLVSELSARHGNIFLLDSKGKILGSLLPNRSRRRDLRPGRDYEAPRPPSPELFERMREDPLDLASLPADGSRSHALEEHFRQELESEALRALGQELARRVREALKSLRRRETAIARDLERAREAREFRRLGELLQSAYGQVKPGANEVEVVDYYDPEQRRVRIELDPRLDLSGNVQRYFRQYRKFSGAVEAIEERLRDCHQAIARLSSVEVEGLAAEEIEALARDLEAGGLLRAPRARRASSREPERARPYREHRSATGKTIWVGKGGRHNDTLSIQLARGHDLWLHALDYPGAHVVVRLQKNEEIDEETLLDAATLAAYHCQASKSRDECVGSVLDIGYTRARNVRKPRGAPPGRVTHSGGKTISIRIEPDRLDRLLAPTRSPP